MTEEISPATTKSKNTSPNPELSAGPADKKPLIATVIGLVVIVLIFIGLGVLMFMHPAITAVLRDMFIILLALETLIIAFIAMAFMVILVYLALKINDLVQLINRQADPLLTKANQTAEIARDTARTVQSRVTVVSDEAVKPVINVVSGFAAAKAIVKTLFKRNV